MPDRFAGNPGIVPYVLLCAMAVLGAAGCSTAKQAAVDPFAESILEIPIRVQVAEDPRGDWQFVDVVRKARDAEFRPLIEPSENFGATDATYWLRVELPEDAGACLLEIDYSPLPFVEFYIPFPQEAAARAGRVLGPDSYERIRTGREVPFDERPMPTLSHVVSLESGAQSPVYIRIRSTYTVIGVKAHTPASFRSKQSVQNVVFGMYYGLIIGIVAYNLFVWLSARDHSFLLYVLFIASLSMQQAVYYGLAFRLFWPDFPLIEDRAYSVFTAAANIFGLAFAYSFLNIREKVAELSLAFRAAIAVSAALLIAGAIWPRGDLLQILRVVALCSAILILVGIVWGLLRGVREARFFLIASGFTTLAVIVFVIPMFRFIPTGPWTRHALLASSAVDALLLSLALADKINILRFEKSEALNRERGSNEDRLMLLELTKALSSSENAVAAVRTVLDHLHRWRPRLFGGAVRIRLSADLSERGEVLQFRRPALADSHDGRAIFEELHINSEDSQERDRLQRADDSGALIAGPVEDPLACIQFETKPALDAREAVQIESVLHSLTLRLQAIRSATESTLATVAGFAAGVVHDLKNDVSAVRFFLEALDSGSGSNPSGPVKPGLLADARASLDDMLAKVHGALDFMRGDRSVKPVDMQTAEFAELLDPRLRSIFAAKSQTHEIRVEYSGPARLDARRMLRAIENIAYNASQAMESGADSRFVVDLALEGDSFLIRLQDSGTGLPPEILERDRPRVSSGTSRRNGGYGLGLAIARSLVEEQGGSLHFESEPNRGTVFTIRMPLTPSIPAARRR